MNDLERPGPAGIALALLGIALFVAERRRMPGDYGDWIGLALASMLLHGVGWFGLVGHQARREKATRAA